MTPLYLYDDARARCFAPFALTRPLGEMRAGAELLRRRWERAFGTAAAAAIVAEHLAEFEEPDAPPAAAEPLAAGSIVANTRCVVSLEWSAAGAGGTDAWTCGGRVAAVRLREPQPLAAFRDGQTTLDSLAEGARAAELPGRWLDEVWSFIADLIPQLHDDIGALGPSLACDTPPGGSIVIGSHPIYVEEGATIEPSVCFDTTAGAVLVRTGAIVRAFTRLAGPCIIGAGTAILGDRVNACAIGDACVVRGEISETVVLGNANKSHDGFVGHSYLGRWANLGAGTITSNLKNTYGTVQLWTPGGTRDTGLIKLGSFFGDHVKTGIGTRLTTGSVVGAGSNVYGSRMPPKYVPPFSWGEGDALGTYRLDKFLETTARAMGRRGLTLGPRARRQLAAAYAASVGLVQT